MSVQPARKRIGNFKEVSLGLSKKAAVEEARRCLQHIDHLCPQGCPLGVDIPGFIRCLREANVGAALDKIREANCFPLICGRICPAPCEGSRDLGHQEETFEGIRSLERYAADFGGLPFAARGRKAPVAREGKRVAIIGSGAAGLTAAAHLAGKGYGVTVFESSDRPGGVLRYGIPAFRLPRKVLDDEISGIVTAGVEIKTHCYIGRTIPFEDLWGHGLPAGQAGLPLPRGTAAESGQGFSAVLLATGGGIPQLADIPGAHLGGVYYAEEFLMRVNLEGGNFSRRQRPCFPLGNRIAVIGSGNTALDCARLAVRLVLAPGGASREVTILPLRPLSDQRAFQQECAYGREEGVCVESPVKPVEILGDGRHFVSGVKCVRLDYADLHAQGRWELTPVPDSEFVLEADTVIMAMGHGPNTLFGRGDMRLNDGGGLWIDEGNSMTSREGVFACGNVIKGGSVVEAMASGKKAAGDIDQYLRGR